MTLKFHAFAKIVLFLVTFSLGFVNSTSAQEWYEEKESPKRWTQDLWYGGSIALGFAGNNGNSQFNFGLFPMVGYKITDNFSVGPKAGFNYSFIQEVIGGQRYRFNPVEWSVGAFTRLKFVRVLFAQLEYEYAAEKAVAYTSSAPEIVTIKNNNIWVGGGYNAGGFEFAILYNLNENTNYLYSIPIEYRTGFTINF